MLSLGKEEYSFSDLQYLTVLFKIKESALRTNLSRLNNSGSLCARKNGKKAYYSLSSKMKTVSKNVARSFMDPDWNNWDNTWIGAAFSVPDSDMAFRHRIRKKLTAYRFTALYPGFWIRPYNKSEDLPVKLNNLKKKNYCSIMTFRFTDSPDRNRIIKLWKLKHINNELAEGLNILEKEKKKINKSGSAFAFKSRINTGSKIVSLLFKDPLLPPVYLPEDWKGSELRKKFEAWDNMVLKISRPYWIKIFENKGE
jgi:phenylacetic acid degradation operon negative regulatory protein